MTRTFLYQCPYKGDSLRTDLVAEIVGMVRVSKERFSLQQRKAAIEQRLQREEQGFTRKAIDIMKDGLRPYAGEKFVTVPEGPKLVTES